jgi:hypothetical protein
MPIIEIEVRGGSQDGQNAGSALGECCLLAALAPMEILGRLLDGFGLAFAGQV